MAEACSTLVAVSSKAMDEIYECLFTTGDPMLKNGVSFECVFLAAFLVSSKKEKKLSFFNRYFLRRGKGQ